jgi:hypothetical protein
LREENRPEINGVYKLSRYRVGSLGQSAVDDPMYRIDDETSDGTTQLLTLFRMQIPPTKFLKSLKSQMAGKDRDASMGYLDSSSDVTDNRYWIFFS